MSGVSFYGVGITKQILEPFFGSAKRYFRAIYGLSYYHIGQDNSFKLFLLKHDWLMLYNKVSNKYFILQIKASINCAVKFFFFEKGLAGHAPVM